MALDAMIFDVDGTLVDTNDLHIEAWRRAFASCGYKINPDRIGVEVGKGGDQLVPSILGKEADEKDGQRLRKREPEEFKNLSQEKGIRIFNGALELLAELRRRKIRTVLATSSNQKQLATIEEFADVKFRDHVDQIVDADDAEQSKPHPDLVQAAVKKAGVSPAQCAMVGDTIWDAKSARGGGVVTVGVTSGGNAVEDLYRAGCRIVYRDVNAILQNLDQTLGKCSPGDGHLTYALLERLIEEALKVAEAAMQQGEAPIGCVLARGDGTIIARGHNEQNRSQNKTAHAEIVTFAGAAGKVPLDAKDLVLACSLEPCVMCTGAAMESAVDTIVFAMPAPADSGSARVTPPQSPESQMPRMIGGIRQQESRTLFEKFLKTNPRPQQRTYIEQLLASPL